MREILFRGKRIDNGELVEGVIVHQTDFYGDSVDRYFIIDGTDTDDNIGPAYRVHPDTVGQFTGLTDKNGKMIFEGDFVVVPLSGKSAKGIVEYFKTDICGFVVITQPQYSNYVLQKNYAYEVIGNIHDNPDLLGGDDK